jgi:ABC-type branched-subunit amino acid transport system substrate-binding protein
MHRFARRGLLIAAAAALLAASACTTTSNNGTGNQPVTGDQTGVTATTIKVGTHQPLTGAAASSYGKIALATKAYFAYINSKGGVYGRAIDYSIQDDGYNPTTTVSVVNKLILQDKVFAILNGLGTPTHTGVLDIIAENHVPDLFVASGSINWNNPTKYPTTFGYQTNYVVDYKILGNYVKTTYPGKKVCFFGQNDDFGQNSLDGLKLGLGADPAAQDTYAVGATSFVSQMTKFKTAGCEVVVTATLTAYTGLAIATSASLQFAPQWVSSGTGCDYTNLVNGAALKAHPELANGIVCSGYGPLVQDTTNPWVAGFKKINDQYNTGNPYDGQALYGMGIGYTFVQALQKAGKDLTREGLIAAVEKGGFTGAGFAPLVYSKTDHGGYEGARLSTVTNNVQAYFGPTYQTNDKNGPVTTYNGTPATPPADMIPTAA